MDYTIIKTAKGWRVENTLGAHIGTFASKREARNIARLLAGWRGSVSFVKA